MLNAIEIENFKCFERLKLRCAPLTVLCGLNGMGKSSVFQALLCLRAYRSRHHDGFSILGNPQDVLYEGASATRLSFKLSSTDGGSFHAAFRFSEDGHWEDEDYDLTPVFWGFDRKSPDDILKRFSSPDQLAKVPDQAAKVLAKVKAADDKWTHSHLYFSNIVHVGAERIGPRRIYDLKTPAFFSEGNGELTLNYLRDRQSVLLTDTDARCTPNGRRRLLDVLEYWLQQVTPGAHLDFDVVQDADALIAGFSFDRRGDVRTRRYRMTNVGFGLAYVLPVLAALLEPKGRLCLIENPEAHLHPRGQAKLAELAVRAALAGVQVMVETHSDHFLDGVRIAVREQLISPQDTAIHYFERDGDKSKVVTPEIDEDGRLSLWPVGFFDQHDDSLARLLKPK